MINPWFLSMLVLSEILLLQPSPSTLDNQPESSEISKVQETISTDFYLSSEKEKLKLESLRPDSLKLKRKLFPTNSQVLIPKEQSIH